MPLSSTVTEKLMVVVLVTLPFASSVVKLVTAGAKSSTCMVSVSEVFSLSALSVAVTTKVQLTLPEQPNSFVVLTACQRSPEAWTSEVPLMLTRETPEPLVSVTLTVKLMFSELVALNVLLTVKLGIAGFVLSVVMTNVSELFRLPAMSVAFSVSVQSPSDGQLVKFDVMFTACQRSPEPWVKVVLFMLTVETPFVSVILIVKLINCVRETLPSVSLVVMLATLGGVSSTVMVKVTEELRLPAVSVALMKKVQSPSVGQLPKVAVVEEFQ